MRVKELYLFTYTGKTSANVLQEACRFLKEELDKLLPKYGKLHKKTSTLFDHPKLRLLTVMSKSLSQIFEEQKCSLAMVEQKLELIRAFAEPNGSYKTDARTFHLHGMARTVHEGTGKYHYRELARLTEAASAAHGAEGAPVDVDALKRRVERYRNRMSSRM
jgi:hypothetical protein